MSDERTGQRRELRDQVVLRELAHPVRLRLLEELTRLGRATATELSQLVGESPANCSWHLRQLARYGFVEEATGGSGRQRPWQPVPQLAQVPSAGEDEPELAQATDALAGMMLAREIEAVWGWHATGRQAPPDWRAASFASWSMGFLTAAELAEFHTELQDLVACWFERHTERIDPAARPPGCRPVRFTAWAFPTEP